MTAWFGKNLGVHGTPNRGPEGLKWQARGAREPAQAGPAFKAGEGGGVQRGRDSQGLGAEGGSPPAGSRQPAAGPGRLRSKPALSVPGARAAPGRFLLVLPVSEMSLPPSSPARTSAPVRA